MTKKGDTMKLNDIATVRTGLVTSRKKASLIAADIYEYRLLNLKCIIEQGYLDLNYAEQYFSNERLKQEYLTQMGDIIVRLSAPYTSVMINSKQCCGYVVSSHFAIIRVDKEKAVPEYIFWAIKHDKTRKKIFQNSSGSTSFGTISSGFFASLSIRNIPLEKQKVVGQLLLLSEREQKLLHKLAEQKAIYNKVLVERIYDTIKRGN